MRLSGHINGAGPSWPNSTPRLALLARRYERIYVAIQWRNVDGAIEFDWDDENRKHLAAHKVTPAEFEQVLNNDPLDLDYELIDEEERYRSVGLTNAGRLPVRGLDDSQRQGACYYRLSG